MLYVHDTTMVDCQRVSLWPIVIVGVSVEFVVRADALFKKNYGWVVIFKNQRVVF
jgi:hypothetical protein